MPIYPGRRKGTWRVTLYVAEEQKQHEWVVEGTKRSAAEFLSARRHERADGLALAKARGAPLFGSFCVEEYKPHAKARLRKSTWDTSRRYRIETLVKHFGKKRLEPGAWRIEDIESYQATRLAAGIGPGTINDEVSVLLGVLSFARTRGHAVVALRPKRLRTPKGRVRVWSLAEVRSLYAAAKAIDPRMLPILHFLFDTGCRKGELVAAQWSWVDWDARLLRIPVTEAWQPKNGKAREVPISSALLVTLRALPREHASMFLSEWRRPFGTFPDAAFRTIRAHAKVAGNIHMTRHTYASHFLQARPDLFLLAQVLGHSTARVTELYAHLLPEHLERARDAVSFAPPGTKTLAATLADRRQPANSSRKPHENAPSHDSASNVGTAILKKA